MKLWLHRSRSQSGLHSTIRMDFTSAPSDALQPKASFSCFVYSSSFVCSRPPVRLANRTRESAWVHFPCHPPPSQCGCLAEAPQETPSPSCWFILTDPRDGINALGNPNSKATSGKRNAPLTNWFHPP